MEPYDKAAAMLALQAVKIIPYLRLKATAVCVSLGVLHVVSITLAPHITATWACGALLQCQGKQRETLPLSLRNHRTEFALVGTRFQDARLWVLHTVRENSFGVERGRIVRRDCSGATAVKLQTHDIRLADDAVFAAAHDSADCSAPASMFVPKPRQRVFVFWRPWFLHVHQFRTHHGLFQSAGASPRGESRISCGGG